MYQAFAGITATQIHRFKESRRFCGRCGHETEDSKTERALVCPFCGQVEYPKISPAVIVAVTDGDRLLMSRYRVSHNPYRSYALIAGFVEIGETFELDAPEITLGRDPHNSVFLNDMTVSRHHARMDLSNAALGLATIEDLGSLNGTWVDGAIVSKASLKDGSTVQIGTFRMVFHTNGRPRRIAAEA